MSSIQECRSNANKDINDAIGVIQMSNSEEKQNEGIGHIVGYRSDIDLNSFMQQQWNDLCNRLHHWNYAELNGNSCPPLPMTQTIVRGGTSLSADSDSSSLMKLSTMLPMPPLTKDTAMRCSHGTANTTILAFPNYLIQNQLLMIFPPINPEKMHL
jgi:hypothetical protein